MTLASQPQEVIHCRGLPGDSGARDPFAALKGLGPGHWSGWLSYEAAAWTEAGNPWSRDAMASLWVARHDPLLRFDLQQRQLWIEGTNPAAMQQLAARLQQTAPIPPAPPTIPLEAWHQHTSREGFADGVRRIRALIASGDLFQANLTACSSTDWPGDASAVELFQRIRHHCPAPFAGLVVTGNGEALLSSSPERFLQVDPTGRVETRPIKGTRPRHSNPDRDADMAARTVGARAADGNDGHKHSVGPGTTV